MGLTGCPYQIPNMRIENPEAAAHTRIGWLRSVYNIQHAFAAQSFVAEMARRRASDPSRLPARADRPDRAHRSAQDRATVEPRRIARALSDRYRAAAQGDRDRRAQEAGWGRKLPQGQGLGLAAHYSFVTYVAAVVEVAVDAKGELTIPRVDIAVDCGPRQSGSRALADRGRVRDGHEPGALERDHVQERPRAAGQLPPVRGRAHEHGAAARSRALLRRSRSTCRSAASASPACRRSRRRCERDLRRDGQADPALADRDQLSV